ncbi:hypothetical protein ACQP0C_20580 [Nocardia sp. CA-129566]|uniref:hypothetical protein n=1 Tax=Nocardia sp. CA-129566 TaxID=3239976 RepID=UPI003D98B832
MYDKRDQRGKRKYTVAQIGGTFGVSRKTIYRHLDRDTANRHWRLAAGDTILTGTPTR